LRKLDKNAFVVQFICDALIYVVISFVLNAIVSSRYRLFLHTVYILWCVLQQ